MKISSEKPPVYDRLAAAFPIDWDKGVIITYGDTVYCKTGKLPLDQQVHEQKHIDQQAAYPEGIDAYVDQYIADSEFRLAAEVEAYKAQLKCINSFMSNRAKKESKINFIYKCLHEMYATGCTLEEVIKMLS